MKKMKKILSAVLAVSLLGAAPVFAEAEEKSVIIDEHFDELETDSTSIQWGWSGDFSIKEIPASTNKSLSSNTEKNSFYIELGSKAVKEGAAVISYDVMFESLPQNQVRIKQVWNSDTKLRPYIIYGKPDGKIIAESSSGQTEIGTITPGKWITLTEIADLSSKQFYTYVDGKAIGAARTFKDADAADITRIQTQYDNQAFNIDNAYVASYADFDTAKADLEKQFASRSVVEKSFTTAAGTTANTLINTLSSGGAIISYDFTLSDIPSKSIRLMQIWDNTLKADNRAALIQLRTDKKVLVNERYTSSEEYNIAEKNNVTLIANADDMTYDAYLNGKLISANIAKYKSTAADFTRIDTQNDSDKDIDVNAYVLDFPSYKAASDFYASKNNTANNEAFEHYGVTKSDYEKAITGYEKSIQSLMCDDKRSIEITSAAAAMLPYSEIFSEDFLSYDESKYSAKNGITAENGRGKITKTSDMSNARLLKVLFSDVPDKFVSEFNFMQSKKSNVDCIMRITDSQGNKEAVKLSALNGDIVIYQKSGSNWSQEVLVDNYDINKDYNFKVYVDNSSKKVQISIDDVLCCGKEFDFMYSDITNMRRIFDTFTNTDGTYYISNINIYSDGLYDAASNIMIPSRLTENIAMPSAEGYNCKWYSNNDAVTAQGAVTRPEKISADVILSLDLDNGFAKISKKYQTRAAAEKNYELKNVVYADSNEFSTYDFTGAIGLKRVKLYKNDDNAAGAVIAAAYDNGGSLIGIQTVSEAKDADNQIGFAFAENTSSVKVFVWNNINSIDPLTDLLSVTR